MPELPEVESIRQSLRLGRAGRPSILGWRAQAATVLWPRTLATPDADEVNRCLAGQRLAEIERRGKYLILRWEQAALLIHLRMSGDIQIQSQEEPPARFLRLAVDFENGMRLAFTDARKFGRVWLVDDPAQVTGGLGPEPFDEALSGVEFTARLQTRRRQLKPLLLDQSFLAGLGNIYTDEALHLARLHPQTLSSAIDHTQGERLLEAIRAVLNDGIGRNGASIDWVYRGGDFQNYFRAYQRTGQPCPVCATPIVRMVVGQRGTHFCPRCQSLE